MKISVIVPAYKPGDGIERVVKSLTRQTMAADEFELIIVDDGSPDDTWDRLLQIEAQHTNVRIERIENSGWPSRPRNIGIDLARGKYLLFMDHDDELFPDGLRASYEYAEKHAADVLSPKELKTSDPSWGLGNFTKNIPNAIPRRGIDSMLPMMPHKFYRRDFLNEHGIRFPEGRRMFWEDVYFNVECYKYAKVISILSDTPVYLWHSTGVNNSTSYETWDDEFWEKLSRLFDFIATTLDSDDLAAARKTQLVHQYKTRILARLEKYLRSGSRPELVDSTFDHALEIIVKHIPEEWDESLPPVLRPKAWLLRRRKIELLRRLDSLDHAIVGRTTIEGSVWIAGSLHMRATTRWIDDHGAPRAFRRVDGRLLRELPSEFSDIPESLLDMTEEVDRARSQLTVRDRTTHVTWSLPTTTSMHLVPLAGTKGMVSVEVHAEGHLDPTKAAQGKSLAAGTWNIHAKNSLLGAMHNKPVQMTTSVPRPALVGAQAFVAYKNDQGGLSVDSSFSLRSVVEDARAPLSSASVDSEQDGSLRTKVKLSIPLDGVHVFPVNSQSRQLIPGTAELVAPVRSVARRAALKVGRRLGVTTASGPAAITVTGHDVTFEAEASAPPGLWQVLFTARGQRRPTPFLVQIGRNGSAHLLPDRSRRARPAGTVSSPKVSVIVPVYNGSAFVEECIRSAFTQSLPQSMVEIIAVDDGSTDGSLAILQRLAREHPRMTVLSQENSGTAAAPRNAGIAEANGEYLFFLDADDLLTRHALEKMVAAADAFTAQVVLGQMQGFGNRVGVPRRPFRTSTVDADMVSNDLIRALGPTKLFRTEHVRSLNLRFPPGLKNGEDQVFVAEAELAARRIIVLADSDYYLVRGHDGDTVRHMSQIPESIEDKLTKTRLLAEVIERYTEPGARRDALLIRPFGGAALEGAFRQGYLKLDPTARHELVDSVADEFGHLWTAGLRKEIVPAARPLFDLVFDKKSDEVTELVQHAHGSVRNLVGEPGADGLFFDAPASVVQSLGKEALRIDAITIKHHLTSLRVTGGRAELQGWVHPAEPLPLPDSVVAIWRHRGSGQEVRSTATGLSVTTVRGRDAVRFTLDIDTTTLAPSGVWDLSLAGCWRTQESMPSRFGSSRSASASKDAVALGSPSIVLYGTASHGNLSLDHGGSVHRTRPARLVEIGFDDDGRPQAVLQTRAPDSDVRVYADVLPAEGRDARHLLPTQEIDGDRLTARLPVPYTTGTTYEVRVSAVQDGILCPVELVGILSAQNEEIEVTTDAGRTEDTFGSALHITRVTQVDTPNVVTVAPADGESETL